MLTGVEYVRSICESKKIPISILEKDCGFANGYLNPKKLKKIPYERAIVISKYLDVPFELIVGIEAENAPTEDDGRRHLSKDELIDLVRETTDEKTLLEIMSLAAEKLRGMKD